MLRHDRRELGFLGALLLGWALVAAPLVHLSVAHAPDLESPRQLASAHSLPLKAHGHSHGPATPGAHGEGSLEHGKAFFTSPPVSPALVLVLVRLAPIVLLGPSPVDLDRVDGTAQPQGP